MNRRKTYIPAASVVQMKLLGLAIGCLAGIVLAGVVALIIMDVTS